VRKTQLCRVPTETIIRRVGAREACEGLIPEWGDERPAAHTAGRSNDFLFYCLSRLPLWVRAWVVRNQLLHAPTPGWYTILRPPPFGGLQGQASRPGCNAMGLESRWGSTLRGLDPWLRSEAALGRYRLGLLPRWPRVSSHAPILLRCPGPTARSWTDGPPSCPRVREICRPERSTGPPGVLVVYPGGGSEVLFPQPPERHFPF